MEYRQANLTVACTILLLRIINRAKQFFAATISSNFDPPEGEAPYDYVFDLTGEVRHDRSEMVREGHFLTVFPSLNIILGSNKNDMQHS